MGAYVEFASGERQGSASFKRLPVEGGPAWINSERYTLDAKAEGTPSPEMMQGPMLQAVLEDRFKLKTHLETRDVPVYELTVAKGGLKASRAEEGSCTPRDPANAGHPLEPGQKPYCGQSHLTKKGPNISVDLRSMTLDDLSKWLDLGVDRLVVDKTAMAGKFDFHLEYALDESSPLFHPEEGDAGDPVFPSITTALQQELGLKLMPAKGPGRFLVVDHIDRPSSNTQ